MTPADLKNKKILVTGGAGFIGSHLVDELIKNGARVVIIDNLSTGRKENINPRAVFYLLDASDSKIEKVFNKEKPDVVYHLAFNTNVPLSVQDPIFDSKSITCSLNVFLNALKFNVKKVVMASSAFVYGNSNDLPFTENHKAQPVSPYAISKIASENYLRFFNKNYGLPIVILRYSTVYGPRQVGGAMADYIRKISKGERAEMYGDGTMTRDYVYVGDVVKANMLALNVSDGCDEPIFNIGSARETSLKEVYLAIARLLNDSDNQPIYLPPRPGEMMRFAVAYGKAEKEIGWKPTVALEDGLARTMKYWGLI
jgi:UDP-glucose 4-epimerase